MNTKQSSFKKVFGNLAVAALVTVGVSARSFAQDESQEPALTPQQEADLLFESSFVIDDEKPEAKVPSAKQRNAKPLEFAGWLLTVTERAERAAETGDHATAVKYYRAIALAVPDAATAFRKLCDSYELLGQLAEAERYCGAALTREGTKVSDYAHHANLIMRHPGALKPQELENLEALFAHLRKQPENAMAALELECLLGLREQSVPRLQACVTELNTRAPDSALSVAYEWRLAVAQLDRGAATRAVERAKQHNMPAAEVQRMEAATSHLMRPWEKMLKRYTHSLLWGAAVSTVIVTCVYWMFRRRKISQLVKRGLHA
jgi:tetratricopeptide (TPR) repeat protein